MKKIALRIKPGFTLIETVVTLAALAVLVTVTVSTFLTVMTKSTKVKVVKAVEGDGNYALAVMEQKIRGAKEVVCNGGTEIEATGFDDETTTFSCLLGSGISFSSTGGESGNLTSIESQLTACLFECAPGGIEKSGQVKISFSLVQANASTTRVEEQAEIDFESLITLRNFDY